VVARDLRQAISAQQVGSAITNMSDRRIAALQQRRGQRGTHSCPGGIGLGFAVDCLIRLAESLLQRLPNVAAR
jgi:hypothetical protein